jgi:Family of unknown function (DUF6624)
MTVSNRIWLSAAVILAACRPAAPASARGWTSAVRSELLARLDRDQAIRDSLLTQVNATGHPPLEILRSMLAIDSANTAWLKPLLLSYGWPTRAELDSESIQAVFLLVQHADHDPAFQAAMLPKLDTAYRRGDIPGESLALLTDRVAKAQGRPQVYGTQTTFDGKVPVIDPIADSDSVDVRRASLGLPPLAVYKHMLDSMVAHAGGP